MKKLLIIFALMASAVSLQAAQLYYQFPDAVRLKDNDRILVFQNNSGNRNLTGYKLKSEILGGDGALVKQSTVTNRHRRIAEFQNYSGQITSFITASGTMILGGRTPQPLSINSISPVNGFTGYSTSKMPYIILNKGTIEYKYNTDSRPKLPDGVFMITSQTSEALIDAAGTSNKWGLYPLTLSPNTTYTLRFYRQALVQIDGEETSSCGTAMTDVGGYCQSTFTTGAQ